ncbi:MAG: hypothetical protein KDE31_31120, partial [Caldilineaceae bacterium]|nr:hypothetical protein [Caldilineaceae bacterium]
MWVAYNPFYPPELAHWEQRNASPDRSHNETWDSLVITGILGFVAYMSLFITIFFWALRWLGLLINRRDNILFFGLLGGLSVITMSYFLITETDPWRFFGVAIPAGMMAGLFFYVTLAAFLHPDFKPDPEDIPRQLLIITLIATVAAHFVEIHFGIAIAATRTYFWVETALLLVLGMRLAKAEPFSATQSLISVESEESEAAGETTESAAPEIKKKSTRRGRANVQRRTVSSSAGSDVVPTTFMTDLLIFLTFVFIYTTNGSQAPNTVMVLFNSIFTRTKSGELINSPMIFFLMLFTWLLSAIIGLAATALSRQRMPGNGWWITNFLKHTAIIGGGWLLYGLIQAGRLVPGAGGQTLDDQLAHVAGHFALYTWIVILWLAVTATVYAWPQLRDRTVQVAKQPAVSLVVGVVVAIAVFSIVSTVNVALVRADIIYKQGQQFDNQRNWVSSIELYRRALAARKTEDHYMLFLGRALLEQAKQSGEEGSYQFTSAPTVDNVLELLPQQVQQMSRTD